MSTPAGEPALGPEDLTMLDELADAIVARGLATPALFFIESMRPLTFVGSQLMIVLRPMVVLMWSGRRWDQVQRVLEVRGSTEQLARRLEARM
ncbi:MAG: hypothetical protein NT062_15125 [Proteobacteria bacterium]|nr:hypothetical protein [Pseudomonadota bacterium]